MIWLLFAAFGCTSKPEPSDRAGNETDTHASGHDSATPDADDTGHQTDPVVPECSTPTLRLVSEISSLQLHPPGAPPASMVLGSCGWGLAVIDVNDDGWPDIVPAGAWASTYALVNDEGVFRPDADVLFDGGALPMANGLTAGDVNGDGRPDLVSVHSVGMPDRVFLNRGDARFESTVLADSAHESQSASLFDADGDGDLDLFVARHIDLLETSLPDLEAGTALGNPNGLYVNDGGTFTSVDPPGTPRAASFMGVPFDADGDGDLDLFVVNDFGAFIQSSELLLNESGQFTPSEDCQCDASKFGMGAAISDIDADGIPDVHVTNFGSPELLMGLGEGRYYESSLARGLVLGDERITGWGTSFVDLNMDGDADLVSTFGPVLVGVDGDWADLVSHEVVADLDDFPLQANAVWMNEGGTFGELTETGGFSEAGVSRAVVVADFNRDGLPDVATSGLLANRHQVVRVYVSEGGCGPGVVLDFPEMSATDLGAKVEWSVEGQVRTTWMVPSTTFSSSGTTLHLGLGGQPEADWVRITPVNGSPVEHADVPAGTTLTQRSYQ